MPPCAVRPSFGTAVCLLGELTLPRSDLNYNGGIDVGEHVSFEVICRYRCYHGIVLDAYDKRGAVHEDKAFLAAFLSRELHASVEPAISICLLSSRFIA